MTARGLSHGTLSDCAPNPLGEPELGQGISVQDVYCASSIHKHSGECACKLRSCEQSIYHQGIVARIRQDGWMVRSAPGNFTIGPVQILRHWWHCCINLLYPCSPTALVDRLAGEDHIGRVLTRELVLLLRWSSILGWWWGWWW